MVHEQTLTDKSENISGRFSKPLTFLIIISPILGTYKIGEMSLGIICLLLMSILIIFFEGKIRFKWPKYFWFYFVYLILTRILNADGLGVTNMFSLSLISFGILLGFSGRYFNLKYGIKIYKIIVLCCCIFFFIQELTYFIIGSRIVGILPLLPLNMVGNISSNEYIGALHNSARSASFFLEPSYFSEYLLPLLAIELFNTNSKNRINFYAILISAVLMLLQSGLGLLIMALIWIIWFLYSIKKSPLYYKIIILFLLIPIAVFGSYFFIKSDIGKGVLARTEEFGVVDSSTSAYVRMFRGYELYAIFPNFDKVFGLNSSNKIKKIISSNSMYSLFREDDLSFNCIQSILIYGGIVGMLLFLLHFLYLFKLNGLEGRMIAIVFIGLSVIAAIYLKHTMLLCYAIMYAYQQQYLDSIEDNKVSIIRA